MAVTIAASVLALSVTLVMAGSQETRSRADSKESNSSAATMPEGRADPRQSASRVSVCLGNGAGTKLAQLVTLYLYGKFDPGIFDSHAMRPRT